VHQRGRDWGLVSGSRGRRAGGLGITEVPWEMTLELRTLAERAGTPCILRGGLQDQGHSQSKVKTEKPLLLEHFLVLLCPGGCVSVWW
jgi:hypothetical protein